MSFAALSVFSTGPVGPPCFLMDAKAIVQSASSTQVALSKKVAMHTPLNLLKFIAKSLGNAVGGGIAGDLIVEVLPGVAQDVWEWWRKDRTEQQRQAEIEAIAQAGTNEVREDAAKIVREVMPDKPAEVRQAVETYLTQIPDSLRRSLRRPSDRTGTTVPPNLLPRKADDLLRLLPSTLSRFKPGEHPLVGVDWELEALLGVGGFGEVWKARNPHMISAASVALKFCLDPSAAKVLRNEAGVLDRVMRQGKHPGIIHLLHTYLSAATPCLEYEYVDGGDLGGLIREWHQTQEGPSPHQAAKVILRLAEIVSFAHQLKPPIVHRDLKPANILVQQCSNGETQFKIADFGIGGVAVGQAIRETTRGTNQGRVLTSALLGSYTPLYASPQQMRGEKPDPRDDVYSLGVIWNQLLTGDLLNGRPGGSRWRKKLTDLGMTSELTDLLESCFEDIPGDRPSDATDLAERLKALLEESDKPAERPNQSLVDSMDGEKRPGKATTKRRWDEESFHEAASQEVSDFVRRLQAALPPYLELEYGTGKNATCHVRLRAVAVFWVWADGRYQWNWHEFPGKYADAVELFKKLIDCPPKNKSSYQPPKSNVLKKSPEEYLAILKRVASALGES